MDSPLKLLPSCIYRLVPFYCAPLTPKVAAIAGELKPTVLSIISLLLLERW